MESHVLQDLLLIFGLGVIVAVAFHRARLPPIVGFLITGVLCGPYGFGLIAGVENVEALAEVGVILLLFTVGIEFSVEELSRVRSFLLTGGSLQVFLTLGVTTAAATALGIRLPVAIFLGMLVALSSTAIVIRMLADRNELDAPHGRAAIGILIFQDLIVVPMVLLTPFLGGVGGDVKDMLFVIAKAGVFIALAIAAARWLVPWLLHTVVNTRKREVFLLTIVLICLGMAVASARAGLSMALGAFIAGLILSESEYSHQALGEVLPLREVFNSLFFVSIGMLFDARFLIERPALIIGGLLAVIALKTVITTGVVMVLGHPLRIALVTGVLLSQIGEFSFVLSKVGTQAGLLTGDLGQIFIAVAVGSMMLTPLLDRLAPRAAARLERWLPGTYVRGRAVTVTMRGEMPPLADHVIIVGYGVNGRNLARMLGRVGIPFIVLELNPDAVRAERRRGRSIMYGDATRPEILRLAGIDRARVLVLAISDAGATRSAVDLARRMNRQVHIVVRSRYVQEIPTLMAVGTDEVVPEEFETSIEISSRVLRRYLVPRDVIEGLIREVRSDSYEMLRTISETHSPAVGIDRILADVALEVYRVEPKSAVAGKTLSDSGLRDRGVTVVAIQHRDSTVRSNPTGTDVLNEGDAILLLGPPQRLSEAGSMFRGG
ncbi:MAG TPA: cation:proton antiporter [Gemmatimonadaceae bacterium]|nr:cation:proton antiporter [Gemmatimonadaceae bacterium]